jgi:protein-export membrane protein SecD
MTLRARTIVVGLLALFMVVTAIPNFIPKEVRERSAWLPDAGLNLGLDLRGGIHWLLRIDEAEAAKQELNQIISDLQSAAAEDQMVIGALKLNEMGDAIVACGTAEELLAELVDLQRLDVELNTGAGGCPEVRLTDRAFADVRQRAVDQSMEVLKQRLNELGTVEPVIAQQGEGRILVQMPGAQDREQASGVLSKTTFLEFKPVIRAAGNRELLLAQYGSGLPPDTEVVCARIGDERTRRTRDAEPAPPSSAAPEPAPSARDASGGDTASADKPAEANGTEASAASAEGADTAAAEPGETATSETATPSDVASEPAADVASEPAADVASEPAADVASEPAADVASEPAAPGAAATAPAEDAPAGELDYCDPTQFDVTEALLVPKEPTLVGSMLEDARWSYDRTQRPLINFTWGPSGTTIFRDFTENNVGERMAIIKDNEVISAPVIRARIGREGVIEGQFTAIEAQTLSVQLRSGALPIPLRIEEERTLGASLGDDAIRAGAFSIAVGSIAVVIFMLVYYSTAGALANAALVLNIFIIIAIMGSVQATLTLPGIAGLVLTVGMAVDANVIIFERIREELRAGKSMRSAVQIGFRRSTLTILDANITTMIAAIVLYYVGRGPVQGFGVTLAIGIVSSVFCALVVTRLLVDLTITRNEKLLRV